MQVATIINFCTRDWRFLARCVEAVRPFSSEVYLSACSHFFDGSPEEASLLKAASYVAELVLFPLDPLPPYGDETPFKPGDPEWPHYLHSVGRYIGAERVKSADYLLFLDVDEIVDTERFVRALPRLCEMDAARLASFFYFRSAKLRAKSFQQNGLLVRRGALPCLEALLTPLERLGAFHAAEGTKEEHVVGEDGLPLIHHFSWVRTRDELFAKVRSWGHREERPWVELLEEELSHPPRLTDSLFQMTYEEVAPFFDPLLERIHPLGIPELKAKSLLELLQT